MKKFIFLLATIVFFGCSDEEPSPTESFFKIYDDSNFDLSYDPIDVVQTVDGYIILAGTELNDVDFRGVRLLKVDLEGEYVEDLDLNDYVIPVGEMYLAADSNTYFFAASNPPALSTVLLGVNPQLELTVEAPIGGSAYPLASNVTSSGNLLLLSYDNLNQNSQISEISTAGNFIGGDSYTIGAGDDVEEEIIDHYLNNGERPLPFFCGEYATGSYYFNGFYNFALSMVFTNFGGSPTGVVQGQSTDAGIRAALPLGGSDFAVAGYQFTDNYQLSTATLSTGGTTSSADLYPGDMVELKSFTPSKIVSYTGAGATFNVFAAETESRQIVLYFYNATTGEVAGLYNIGFVNPFRFASMKVTDDNSLIVLGTTFVAGRFERVSLTKISASQIADIVN